MSRTTLACTVLAAIAVATTTATAQQGQAVPPAAAGDFQEVSSERQERLTENHFTFTGSVDLKLDGDTRLAADRVELFRDEDRAVATGNVVFSQGKNQLAADRAEFNTRTKLGTFYEASGIASVQPPRRPMGGGLAPPPLTTSETEVYFFGEVVEKIGPKKYKIKNGGFSTCVQPTPRWDLHADTVVLNIDHYTLLRNATLNVKGVPLLYVPILYYPTKEEDRATGILIPTYGVSSLRGQAIHNAFFWAINRSQDATIMHDWYSRAGQGYGGEYRYNYGGGSDGTLTTHLLDQRETSTPAGTLPKTRAFEFRGSANQPLPGPLHARGRVDYFSSVSVMQTYNSNVYDASRNQRSYGANVTGAWRTFSLNATYDRSEYFTSATTSGVIGSSPRVALNRNERPLFRNSPVYFSANTEFAHLDRVTKDGDRAIDDRSLGRLDLTPQIRYPFKKWQWFTVNSSFAWRDTYYTRSLDRDATTGQSIVTDDDVNRRYYTVQAQAVGPVLNRIFSTPKSGYAERFKHTIEPFLNVQRTSAIDSFSRIVQVDGVDTIVGNTTNFTYGVNNRLYAKRRAAGGRVSQAQEILSVEVIQTYYTSARAAQFDPRYNTSFSGAPPSNFSPISIAVRATPSTTVNASVRAEIDSRHRELRTITANSTLNLSAYLQSNLSWSKRFFVPDLSGFNNPRFLDHSLNASTNVHTRDNRVGLVYAFNYDFLRKGFLQQRISGFYSAQCCGIALEYQTYNFAGLGNFFPADRRFFISFSLAGLGSFSPVNGGMSGIPR
jgi:LPS-assembly protein